MPEGPIIVILKEQVEIFIGKTVKETTGSANIDMKLLSGKRITSFKSFGKNFFICFDGFFIRIHLMMFGSYTINTRKKLEPKLSLTFDDGELNFYTCIVELLEGVPDQLYDFGADVMSEDWAAEKAFKKLQAHPDMMACDALMDQQVFAGVGNIIKNEVLFRIKVHPKSLLGAMPTDKLKEMINEAVIYSFDFLKWKKEQTFSKHWQAYEQKICPRDKVGFVKANTGKSRRGSYYCNLCQARYND